MENAASRCVVGLKLTFAKEKKKKKTRFDLLVSGNQLKPFDQMALIRVYEFYKQKKNTFILLDLFIRRIFTKDEEKLVRKRLDIGWI